MNTKSWRNKKTQLPPLTFTDARLLFTVGAIILLITTELSSPYYGLTNLTINRKNLKNAAFVVNAIFLIIVAARIISIITT